VTSRGAIIGACRYDVVGRKRALCIKLRERWI
jgi:hypothetical protein